MISPFLTHEIPPPSKHSAKDPQRSRFYKMEREFVGMSVNHAVPTEKLKEMARHACEYYGIKPIRVIVYNKPSERRFGEQIHFYDPNDNLTPHWGHAIRLNRGFHGANVATLLHELAHYIVEDTYEDHHDHGKKFVGVYMHLMDKYRMIPSDAFRVVAKRYRIKIAGKFKPCAIRG